MIAQKSDARKSKDQRFNKSESFLSLSALSEHKPLGMCAKTT
jgi:hypothetical protein